MHYRANELSFLSSYVPRFVAIRVAETKLLHAIIHILPRQSHEKYHEPVTYGELIIQNGWTGISLV